MTDERNKRRTRIAVLVGVALYAAYDLWTYLRHGGYSTISTAVGEWMAAPWYGWVACVVLGGLFGHFAGMMEPHETPNYLGRVAVIGGSAAVLYLLTLQT